ncbi:MAG: hypothetical protein EBZ36_18545 [Acidobacteria bacterium]|nr:hypothetical protein [Acidobacteriota bacterium]
MKLTYEQMRQLSEIGDGPGKLTITKDGKVLRPIQKKWGPSQTTKETGFMCMAARQRPSHALTANHSQTSPQASSLPLRRPREKQ